jgi:hypothetical protein
LGRGIDDGLTVGQTLTLASIGRACHATSKRGFAGWASTTTLGELAGVDPERLTSQHFWRWDQMDQLPVTIVFDKGNVSRSSQLLVDGAKLHDVTGLTAANQQELVERANPQLAPVVLPDGDTVHAYRERSKVWGVERTAIVLLSERLRQGQMRGILQHATLAQHWLENLAQTLRRGKKYGTALAFSATSKCACTAGSTWARCCTTS